MKKLIYIITLSTILLSGCSDKSYDATLTDDPKPTDIVYNEPIVIKFADNLPESHINVQADYEFKKLVEEKSDGKIIVEIYPNSELGSEQQTTELLQKGEIQMESAAVLTLSNYDKDYNLLMLPYLFKDTEHLYRVLDNEIADEFLYPTGLANFVGLSWLDAGARNFYSKEREIKTIEDFKGLVCGVEDSDIINELIKILGMTTVPLNFADTHEMFHNGKINTAENNYISYVSSNNDDIAKYVIEDAHVRIPELIIINKDFYNSLPYDYQLILKESAMEATTFQRLALAAEEEKLKQHAIENGTIITKLSPDELSNLQEASMPIYDKYISNRSDLIDKILSIK